MTQFDTMNRHMVSVCAGKIALLNPPAAPITNDEALVLAAWLVALADPLGERFGDALEAVQST